MHKFYCKKQDISIADVTSFLKLTPPSTSVFISEISVIEDAKEGDLTFFQTNKMTGGKYIDLAKKTTATFCLVKKSDIKLLPNSTTPIVVDNPYISFLELYDHFYSLKLEEKSIDQTAQIGNNVFIGEGVRIEENVKIEDGAYIGDNVSIGKNSIVEANATIKFSKIGKDVRIGSGVKIGQDGFGFLNQKVHGIQSIYKIQHFGGVEIGNSVSIGCNTCVDRGLMSNTVIKDYVKIDNLVQVAHNVKIGEGTIIAGCVAIAGSVNIGRGVLVGGRACIVGHVSIGDNCIIYGQTAISKSWAPNSKILAGWAGEDHKTWFAKLAVFNKLFYFILKLIKLKEKIIYTRRKFLPF